MSKIQVLEKNIADKIAAGEVVERPISIVKELVENSIDAGATSIVVELKNGGKSYIRVTDNGIGIPSDEVETAFLRHATSKIATLKDLNAIETLGFRGEALSSIASVSRVEMITKTGAAKLGKRILIHGSEVVLSEEIGCPDGTTIIVSDLFYNTPARLKFMKPDSTESALIIDFLSEIALCYKDIRFRLINNGKDVFNTTGDGKRINSIIRIYSDVDTKNLVEVNYTEDGLKLTGYISTPAMNRNNRGQEIFFVNGRVVNSKTIEKGVSLGYKERLFEGRYPICFLFLEVDAHTIDVNIHPNKRAVRFDDEALISDFVCRAIVATLDQKKGLVDAGNVFKELKNVEETSVIQDTTSFIENARKEEPKKYKIPESSEQVDIKSLLSNIDNKIVEQEPVSQVREHEVVHNYNKSAHDYNYIFAEATDKISIQPPSIKPFDFKDLSVLGAIFDTYITATDGDCFYMIDQHAAQERIFYEKLVNQYDSQEKDRQILLSPIVVNVSQSLQAREDMWLEKLVAMGYEIEYFGSNSYRISEIPMFMDDFEAEKFVNEFISNIGDSVDLRNTIVVDKLIMMSCKAAIKANDKLSLPEITALINDLSNCVNPYSCPHGRPTVIKLTKYEIERMFKRV